MAIFSNMIVTTTGKTMYAKTLQGNSINFVEARVGNGAPTADEVSGLTSLVNEISTAAITDIYVEDGKAIMTVAVNNENIADTLEITEIGLFAEIVNTDGTVEPPEMYAYCYAVEGVDVIPPVSNGRVEWLMQLELYISNATGEETEQGGGTWQAALAAHVSEADNKYALKSDTHVSTSAPTNSDGKDGDVWYVYEA